MASLRFWFSSPQLPNLPHHSPYSFCKAFVAAAASGSSLAAGVAVSQKPINPIVQNAFFFNNHRSFHFRASASISDGSSVCEPKTGVSFTGHLNDFRQLLGTGSWKKELTMKDYAYAFGVYADVDDLKRVLEGKYGLFYNLWNKGKHLREDLLEKEICMTVRLQMYHSKSTIRLVRGHFEEHVGGRLRELRESGYENLLHRFTSQFKDEYEIGKGSVIDLSRERGYKLRTTIDGEEAGTIQSQPLCRSIFDLFIGEYPFDTKAKNEIERMLEHLL